MAYFARPPLKSEVCIDPCQGGGTPIADRAVHEICLLFDRSTPGGVPV